MKRLLAAIALLVGVLLLPLAAGAAKQQAITIESWLQRAPDAANPLVQGQVRACAKVWFGDYNGGAPTDVGGAPAWTSGTYGDVVHDLAVKCGSWTYVGGYVFDERGHLQGKWLRSGGYRLGGGPVPDAPSPDVMLYAPHEITLTDGSFSIEFSGYYSATFAGTGEWVISGGTGAYEGLQGSGTWVAQGYVNEHDGGLYFVHTEHGYVNGR